MKATIVREIGAGFVTEDVQIAAPIGREVLVDVKASGLCHTDLTYSRTNLGSSLPMLLGHEVAGVVAQVGPDVTELAVGDHVVGCLVQSCGRCTACLTGRTFQCEHPEATLRHEGEPPRLSVGGEPLAQVFGLGGFAQQALIHENQLVKVSESIPFPQAALLGCGVVTGAGAVINTSNTQAGDSIVVIGAGGVGLNAINGALVAGASTIIAVDVADDKLAKARRFGATHTINSTKTDAVAEVMAITGRGADAAFDFVGIPAVTQSGLDMIRPGGGLYLIGILDPSATLPLLTIGLIGTQKRIQGVYMGSTTPKHDIPLYADLYLQGRFNLDDLLSREIALDEVNEGYDALKDSEVTRVVITSGLS
ncbi:MULTISPECIES: Zn-dependent alcohol dehydrogenase [Microbacteriaceae]|jgi:S-(hydroxymethyl)glutathione dehydrogenase/alcohol dehydrogenase|uniref:Zn-dependent alcohol dehydrogenase n=1 Tax=Antiquaquibacter soli TaxID=3064523 RepID=A0ABT9BNB3_9MICO|nr:Zn-dependent alcohol dehydrogenase [Protaetiibacter sp. WY-16]MDO7882523.1 Zn-dependent alcohol dehydrogenase [Protaetiibacter sp. WY-16]